MIENITITIKDILQSYSFPDVIPHDEPWRSLTVDQIIENGKDKFFDFVFPWYADDKTGLDDFKNLFLRKNYMKQIGQETTAQFKLYVQARLMEKMPLYKQLYDTTLIEYDPLVNRKITTTTEETENREQGKESNNVVNITGSGNTTENNKNVSEGTSEGNQDRTNNIQTERTTDINNQAIHSENPEITMANKDYASTMDRERKQETGNGTEDTTENISDSKTVNNTVTEDNESNSEASSNETGNLTENEKEEKQRNNNEVMEGFYGESQADAILKYRETIININEMICNDMNDLFLGYYGGVDYGISY